MFKIVEAILDSATVTRILKGSVPWIKPLSRRRSLTKTWLGVANLPLQLNDFRWVELPDGRVDISLPGALGNQLVPSLHFPGWTIRHFNLLVNPPNPNTQVWHQDQGDLGPDYVTLLIPLNDAKGMGQTEFKIQGQTVQPRVEVGQGLWFTGETWHRGTPNTSSQTRYVLYCVLIRQGLEQVATFEAW